MKKLSRYKIFKLRDLAISIRYVVSDSQTAKSNTDGQTVINYGLPINSEINLKSVAEFAGDCRNLSSNPTPEAQEELVSKFESLITKFDNSGFRG